MFCFFEELCKKQKQLMQNHLSKGKKAKMFTSKIVLKLRE